MTEYDKILIASLESYLNDKELHLKFEYDTAKRLIKRAREQKIIPVVFLKNSPEFKRVLPDDEYTALKTEVILGVTLQIQRNAELVRICRIFESEDVEYSVIKGAVCRALYNNSEYRTSSDEDLLVRKDKIDKAKSLLLNSGYVVTEEKKGEIKLLNPSIKSFVELHVSLVDESVSDNMKKISDIFDSHLNNPFDVVTGTGRINTFFPTYGFLALCVHFYNHFVRGGIGIRPVMDIAAFIKAYSDEIDFDYCFSVLRTINAEKMIKTVIALCTEYFGIEYENCADRKAADRLLCDILEAGAYGTSDLGRTHSGAITKSVVHKGEGVVSSAISALFPSEEDVVLKHPELQGKSAEIRKYRIKRIMNFAGERGKIETIKTAKKRKKLMKKLGIVRAKNAREE